jgi:hypothetical protein
MLNPTKVRLAVLINQEVVALLDLLVYLLADVHVLEIRNSSLRLRNLEANVKLSVHNYCLVDFNFGKVFLDF